MRTLSTQQINPIKTSQSMSLDCLKLCNSFQYHSEWKLKPFQWPVRPYTQSDLPHLLILPIFIFPLYAYCSPCYCLNTSGKLTHQGLCTLTAFSAWHALPTGYYLFTKVFSGALAKTTTLILISTLTSFIILPGLFFSSAFITIQQT